MAKANSNSTGTTDLTKAAVSADGQPASSASAQNGLSAPPASITFDETLYHPQYTARAASIQYWMDIYHGSSAAKSYLPQFAGETRPNYEKRKEETAFPKLSARALSVFASHIFSKPPDRGNLPDKLQPFVQDIDGNGTDADVFFADAFGQLALPAGMCLLLVTRPNTAEMDIRPANREQEKALGLRSVVVPFPVLDLLKWGFGPDGKLQYVVLRDSTQSAPSFDKPHVVYDLLRVWTLDYWALYKRERKDLGGKGGSGATDKGPWTLSSWGQNSIKEVPLVAMYNIRGGLFKGLTEMGMLGLADLNLDIFVKTTWLDQGLKMQGFPLTVFMTEKENPDQVDVGPGKGVVLDQGDDARLLETTGQALGLLRDRVSDSKLELLDTAFRQIAPTKTTGGQEAAEKKRLDMAQLAAVIQDKAKQVQEAERQVWRLIGLWEGLGDIGTADTITYSVALSPESNPISADVVGKLYATYGLLDRQTAVEVIRSGGQWPDEVDYDEMEARRRQEEMDLGNDEERSVGDEGSNIGDEQ